MAKKTLKIADKPTLDELKALLENSGYGLEAIKSSINENMNDVSRNIIYTPFYTGNPPSTLTSVLNVSGSGYLHASIIKTVMS